MSVHVRRALVASVTVLAAVTTAACDGNAQDDVDAIEENIDEGADEVGEVVEDAGEELQNDE